MTDTKKMVNAVIDAALQGTGCTGYLDPDMRLAILDAFTAPLDQAIKEAVAEELDRQATFYRDAAGLYEPARDVAQINADDMAMTLDMQIRTMREVAARLHRRAAHVRGISPEELAARAILTLPADGEEPPAQQEGTASERGKPGNDDGATGDGDVSGSGDGGDDPGQGKED